MRKIDLLIISFYYPPIRSVASNRLYSFAKYLDRSRFNIHVLCAAPHDSERAGETAGMLDGVHVRRLPDDGLARPMTFSETSSRAVHLAKAGYNRLLSFFILDQHRRWRNRVVEEASSIIRKDGIDVVLSSFSPVAAHLAALELTGTFPGLKWIADMRDEMSRNLFLPRSVRRRLAGPERSILARADAVTSVSRPLLQEFQALAGSTGGRFLEVRNGYDFDLPEDTGSFGDRFVIAYTGSFYGPYTPYPFFEGLDRFLHQQAAPELAVRIVGARKPINVPAGVRQRVSFEPAVAHREALEIMRQSSLLLLYHPGNERKGYYSGKLFEYLASLRPVLAIVDPDSVAAELVRSARAGRVVDGGDVGAVAEAIGQAYRDWKERRPFAPDRTVIGRHHRRAQAQRLQVLIEDLCTGRGGNGTSEVVL